MALKIQTTTRKRQATQKPDELPVRVVLMSETSTGSNIFACKVTSSRHAHLCYDTVVDARALINGQYRSSCNCPAGTMRRFCRHQAVSIEQADTYKTERRKANQLRIGAYEQDWRHGWPWGDESA